MRELVPLTNAVAAMMIASALSGCGVDHAILTGAGPSVPTGADADAAATAANSAAEGEAALPANDRSRENHSARWLLAAV